MNKIFKALHKASDDVQIEHHAREKRFFVTVNGQHVGFVHDDDGKIMAEALLKALPATSHKKAKSAATKSAATKPAPKSHIETDKTGKP